MATTLDPRILVAHIGQRARVYWNIVRQQYSVLDPASGRVIGHTSLLELRDATFVVQPAGRAKVLASGQKNVHAFIDGTIVELPGISIDLHDIWDAGVEVFYNPFRHPTFVALVAERPVLAAERVACAYTFPRGLPPRTAFVMASGITFGDVPD